MLIGYGRPRVIVGGGSGDKLIWYKDLAFSDHTHNYLPLTGGKVSGDIIASSFGSDNTINIRPEFGNEINFGGSSTDTNIYFGYRSYQGRRIPTAYHFGSGKAAIRVGNIYQYGQIAAASAVQSSAPSTSAVLWAY